MHQFNAKTSFERIYTPPQHNRSHTLPKRSFGKASLFCCINECFNLFDFIHMWHSLQKVWNQAIFYYLIKQKNHLYNAN